MRDSSPRAGAKESVHADFPHGLVDIRNTGRERVP
jgi:hypothetical protein